MAAYTQSASLSISTPLGKDVLLLVSLQGNEGISRLFHFQLGLVAENQHDVAFDKLLGQGVTVNLALPQGKIRHFHGIVCRIIQGERDDVFTSFRLEMVPRFWLWTRRTQSRLFQHKTVPDILKEVLAGLDVKFEIQGAFHPRNYCTQYNETDFAFASRLMEEEGIYYYFKHSDGAHQLVVANTPPSHADVPEYPKVIYQQALGGEQEDDRVWTWEKSQELRSGKYTLWDHHFELPGQNLAAESTIADSVAVGKVTHKLKVASNDQLETYVFPGRFARRFDGIDRNGRSRPGDLQKLFEDNQRTCKLRMDGEASGSIEIRGSSACRQFSSGHKFTLERHHHGDGTYVLTAVEHQARLAGDIRQGTQQSLSYENTFACVPIALPFRPPRTTAKPVMQGTQSATVVGPAGEEVHIDQYGRVKVQFHWDRQGKFDGDSSCWVRVAQFWAGKSWGACFWPRVGHEVVVGFEEGDPDRPIIIGSVYNAQNMPPFPLPGRKLVGGIKSCSQGGDPGGNFNGLIFYDQPGDEHIQLHSERYEIAKNQSAKHNHVGQTLINIVGGLSSGGSGSGGGPGEPQGSGWGAGPPPETSKTGTKSGTKTPGKETPKQAANRATTAMDSAWLAEARTQEALEEAKEAARQAQKALEDFKKAQEPPPAAAPADAPAPEPPYSWVSAVGEVAKNLDITFGHKYEAMLGLKTGDYIGTTREIFFNPFAWISQRGGAENGALWKGIGGAMGKAEFKFCSEVDCLYGTKVEVLRGAKLEYEGDLNFSAGAIVAGTSMLVPLLVAGLSPLVGMEKCLQDNWVYINLVRQIAVGVAIGLEAAQCIGQIATRKVEEAKKLNEGVNTFLKDANCLAAPLMQPLLNAAAARAKNAANVTQAAPPVNSGATPALKDSHLLVDGNLTLEGQEVSIISAGTKTTTLLLQAVGAGADGNVMINATKSGVMTSGAALVAVAADAANPTVLLETKLDGTITLHQAKLGKDEGPKIVLSNDAITLSVGKDKVGSKITLTSAGITLCVGDPDTGGRFNLTSTNISSLLGDQKTAGQKITLESNKVEVQTGQTTKATLQSGQVNQLALTSGNVKLTSGKSSVNLLPSTAKISSLNVTLEAQASQKIKATMTTVEAGGIMKVDGKLVRVT